MSLSKPVPARFSEEKLESDYEAVNDLLDIRVEVERTRRLMSGILDALRELLSEKSNSVQLETLLLLRALSNPETRSIVEGELRRNGLEIWQPSS